MAVSANKLELLQIADAVAREKTIDRRIVIAAMEDAIQKAAQVALRGGNGSPRRDRRARPARSGCSASWKWSSGRTIWRPRSR